MHKCALSQLCTWVHSRQCTTWILLKCRIPHTRKTNKLDYGWIRSTMCSMSPAICQSQTEVPKHQICSSSQISQWCKKMVISTILLQSQQYRAVHQHQHLSQWSYNRPYLAGEGGYRGETGTFWEQLIWSILEVCLRTSWITLWRFPFLLVNCKGSTAPAVTSSNINVWLLDALS